MTNAKKYLKEGTNINELASEMCKEYYEDTGVTIPLLVCTFFSKEAKPTLTEDERIILKNIDKTYTHISRTYGDIWVGIGEETADSECKRVCVFNHLFQFIKERRRISNRGIAEGVISTSKKRR